MSSNGKIVPKRLLVGIGLLLAAICASIWGLGSWWLWHSRQNDLARAEIETRNIARSVAQYADDTFDLANTVLIGLVARLQAEGTSPATMGTFNRLFEQRKPTLGRIRGLFVYDEDGRWLATTEKVDMKEMNNGDRDYFVYHKTTPGLETFIGKPVQSRSGGQWIVTASRRFNHPDGSFGGVVLATVDVAHFTRFFGRFDLGQNGSISLLSRDGIILSRFPEDGRYVGRDMSKTRLFATIGERASEGATRFKSPLDGKLRLSSYTTGSLYPFVALATVAEDDVLSQWRAEAFGAIAFIWTLTALIAAAGSHLIRQMLRADLLAEAVAGKEADFRLLAEGSSDMVLRIDSTRRIRYVSPSCARILGWDARVLIGTDALSGLDPADRERINASIDALEVGDIEEDKIVCRTTRRDGAEIWLETSFRATRSDTGALNYVVAISRDISANVDLNARLFALARTDALTNLPNRRHFDERFAEEWTRSSRYDGEHSLVLVDVDLFKKYNDHYGHLAGDAALKEFALVLAAQVRRPADFAARFGGEEFVLLLPDTDAQGARLIGERIRHDLALRALRHSGNPPSFLITASLGIVTIRASHGASMAEILKRADEALYKAKEAGRDTIVTVDITQRPTRDGWPVIAPPDAPSLQP